MVALFWILMMVAMMWMMMGGMSATKVIRRTRVTRLATPETRTDARHRGLGSHTRRVRAGGAGRRSRRRRLITAVVRDPGRSSAEGRTGAQTAGA